MLKAYRPLPPIERLHELFCLDGGTLIRRINAGPRGRAGSTVGYLTGTGYLDVQIDGLSYRVHRLIWAMVNGQDPGKLIVDHIDRNPLNNHPSNLRLVTARLNIMNSNGRKDNRSGQTGVFWCNTIGKWRAVGHLGGRPFGLGNFKDKDEAIAARQAWEAEQWQTA